MTKPPLDDLVAVNNYMNWAEARIAALEGLLKEVLEHDDLVGSGDGNYCMSVSLVKKIHEALRGE